MKPRRETLKSTRMVITTAIRTGKIPCEKAVRFPVAPAEYPVAQQPQPATNNSSSQTAPGMLFRFAAKRVASKSMVSLREVTNVTVKGEGDIFPAATACPQSCCWIEAVVFSAAAILSLSLPAP